MLCSQAENAELVRAHGSANEQLQFVCAEANVRHCYYQQYPSLLQPVEHTAAVASEPPPMLSTAVVKCQVAQLEVERMAHELHAAHEHRDALLLRLRESDSAREQVRRLSPVKRKSLKR